MWHPEKEGALEIVCFPAQPRFSLDCKGSKEPKYIFP